MPYKAHEAAAYGVPMVVSPLIGQQMQWLHGIDYFAAGHLDEMADYCICLYSDESLWEQFRANSLARVESELNPVAINNSLRAILDQVAATSVLARIHEL